MELWPACQTPLYLCSSEKPEYLQPLF
uniref:Uncharacterized protein n=1 Tax=Arundo donax TaxID=35708 RepID=A0A0A9GDD4_ARUDO